jgi:hypothetical protein
MSISCTRTMCVFKPNPKIEEIFDCDLIYRPAAPSLASLHLDYDKVVTQKFIILE